MSALTDLYSKKAVTKQGENSHIIYGLYMTDYERLGLL